MKTIEIDQMLGEFQGTVDSKAAEIASRIGMMDESIGVIEGISRDIKERI